MCVIEPNHIETNHTKNGQLRQLLRFLKYTAVTLLVGTTTFFNVTTRKNFL